MLTYCDLQADIARDLVRAGIAVHAFNQRDVAGILAMVRMLGAMVGAPERAGTLADDLERRLDAARARHANRASRPRVYVEEWDEPMIAGIGWVSQIVEAAGGRDVFAALAREPAAKDRVVGVEAVIAAAPDVILGSWCGKRFRPDKVAARPGFGAIPAVRDGRLYEVASSIILQPGPAALTDGLDRIEACLWAIRPSSR